MLRLENIKKSFSTDEIETVALNGVSLEVKEGDFLAIMGPSGCGKSTLLNIIGLLDVPNEGKYYLNDREVSTLNENDRTRLRRGTIGFVFQSFNLIDELNVYENIELPLRYMNIGATERKERVTAITKEAGTPFPDTSPMQKNNFSLRIKKSKRSPPTSLAGVSVP